MSRYEDIAGSGRVRVTTRKDVDHAIAKRVEPLEGTQMSLFNSIIPNFFAEQGMSADSSWMPGNASLGERVWVANRCIQLNAQQIGAMPLRFQGSETSEDPAWLAMPDANWYPNGIADALLAMVTNIYGWGFAIIYMTSFYASGFPQSWTVLDPALVSIDSARGARTYKVGDTPVDPMRVVQIDRNPSSALHGTSALRAYAQQAWGLLAAGNQSTSVNTGGIPQTVLKPKHKQTKEQAELMQAQWGVAAASRGTLPAVLPPDLEFEVLSFNPADLALLDTQEFNARALATAFGVPSVLLNMALQGGLTYQNPASLGEMWWRFELRTLAKRIADAFTARMLPRGQWVWFDAADTFMPLTEMSEEDDPQLSQVAKASPNQPRPLTVIGQGG